MHDTEPENRSHDQRPPRDQLDLQVLDDSKPTRLSDHIPWVLLILIVNELVQILLCAIGGYHDTIEHGTLFLS